jgi:hypothetical protein
VTAKRRSRRRTDNEDRAVYTTLRQLFRTRCVAERAVCFFCSGPIDWTLKHPDPGSFEVHHLEPVALRPDLELEVALWRPSHRLCNSLNMAAYDPDGAGEVGGVPDTGIPSCPSSGERPIFAGITR